MNEQERYAAGRRKAEEKIGFYIHAAVYVLVNTLLATINLTTAPETLWFYWPLAGWGIGVVFHAVAVFVFAGQSSLKERMVERIVEKEREKERSQHP